MHILIKSNIMPTIELIDQQRDLPLQWSDSDLYQDHYTCPASSETSEDRRQDVLAKHLSETSSRRSRGHSSVQRLNCHEITPPSKSITIPMSILPVPGKTEAADLLNHRVHSWRSLRRQIIPRFKRATLIPMQIVTENSRNHSYNQEHNTCRYEEISTRKSCDYENPCTRTTNNDSHGIYALRVGGKKGTNHSLLYQRLKIESSSVDFTVTL